MAKAIVVQGLGFGDEGKGGTVDFLVRKFESDLVVRYCGGHQAAHNVLTDDGRNYHTFSQFGAGALAGSRTYLGPNMIVEPVAMTREAMHLRDIGVDDPWGKISAHPGCLVTTWFHRQYNRFIEMVRGDRAHGSCNVGIGATRSYAIDYGEDAITLRDVQLGGVNLGPKLEAMKKRFCLAASCMVHPSSDPRLCKLAQEMRDVQVRFVCASLQGCSQFLTLSPDMPKSDMVIFEGSQGVLLDEKWGFSPYTTWSNVTPLHAIEMVAAAPEITELCIMGVTRPYMTRHGHGPFPTEGKFGIPLYGYSIGNIETDGRGPIRSGPLDLMLLNYAKDACGPIGRPDCLSVTCVDHLQYIDWIGDYCEQYEGNLPVTNDGAAMFGAVPVIKTGEVFSRLSKLAPICLTSDGPHHRNRTFIGDLPFKPVSHCLTANPNASLSPQENVR